MTPDTTGETHCGTVAIIGRPNAGKSTLLNALLGQKISIVSPKVQTTRNRITGILTQGQTQIILLDTPGMMAPQTRFERAMVAAAQEAQGGVDIIVHLVDTELKNPLAANQPLMEHFPPGQKVFLVFNKIDRINKARLLELATSFNAAFAYAQTFMIAALKNDGLEGLVQALRDSMPVGPFLFDADQVTDMPLRLLAAEITREKIFHQLHEELPRAALVETETWERDEKGLLHIGQAILIQRESQKAIVLGKGGARIKAIGIAAREELEILLEEKINLKLFVKVEPDWPEQAEIYSTLGLNYRA